VTAWTIGPAHVSPLQPGKECFQHPRFAMRCRACDEQMRGALQRLKAEHK